MIVLHRERFSCVIGDFGQRLRSVVSPMLSFSDRSCGHFLRVVNFLAVRINDQVIGRETSLLWGYVDTEAEGRSAPTDPRFFPLSCLSNSLIFWNFLYPGSNFLHH